MLPNPIFLNIHMYGIMVAVGILFAFAVLAYLLKKKNTDKKFADFLFYDGIVSIAVGFVSAALFQAIYNYIKNPNAGFHFGDGITFLGGLIGGAACFICVYFIFRKKFNMRLYQVLSILPCCILIAHAFGRVGCFFAGCCYGKETNGFWGVKFPNLSSKVYPTQLFEAVFLLIMFTICFYLVLQKSFRYNMSLYLISYGIFRFFIELLRGDDRGTFLYGISPSQFWSVAMVITGIASVFIMKFFSNKEVRHEKTS